MNRRNFLRTGAVLAANPALAQTVERSRTGSGPLKITKVEAFVIRTPGGPVAPESLVTMPPIGTTTGGLGLWNRLDHASPSRSKGHTQAVLVRIDTNQGLTGWGECHAPEAPRVHQRILSDLFAPILIGQNALEVQPLWERLYSTERLRGYSTGFYTEALAGVDLALWDLLGQFTGMPVYRLLGGKYRDRIPTYQGIGGASITALKENAAKAMEEGFKVVKMGFSKGSGTNDITRVATISDAIKDKGQLLIDSLGAFKLYEAVKLGREIDRLPNIGWWEDPLMPDDLTGYPRLAEALDTAICAGEELCNRFQFRDFLAARICRYPQSGYLPGRWHYGGKTNRDPGGRARRDVGASRQHRHCPLCCRVNASRRGNTESYCFRGWPFIGGTARQWTTRRGTRLEARLDCRS